MNRRDVMRGKIITILADLSETAQTDYDFSVHNLTDMVSMLHIPIPVQEALSYMRGNSYI